MRRSRAFVLTEILMTLMLQAGFVLVLCSAFYVMVSFYTKTQQVMTARNHAERVIAFFDDKIRNAGLGLWVCDNSEEIRGTLGSLTSDPKPLHGRSLPVSLTVDQTTKASQTKSGNVHYGGVITLLYAQRDFSTGNDQNILLVKGSTDIQATGSTITLLDPKASNYTNSEFNSGPTDTTNIKNWAVMEAVGVPFCIPNHNVSITHDIRGYGKARGKTIPQGGELMYLRCMQMFVQDTSEGRSLAICELNDTATNWGTVYNWEKGILEIYMELDTSTRIFTLWVLASGGTDSTLNNPRPSDWPSDAAPATWSGSGYEQHIVYVSRASWKLNNIPPNFTWN